MGLAGGQTDLALRAGKARQRVHHQQNAQAPIPEILGDGGADVSGLRALDRRAIGGCTHHDAARQPIGAKNELDELPHLASALADQHDHVDIALGTAREHSHQGALADACCGEDAHALALAQRHQAIHDPHAGRHGLFNQPPTHRVRCLRLDRYPGVAGDCSLPVRRLAQAVEHAPQQGRSNRHRQRAPQSDHARLARQPDQLPERRQQCEIAAEAHHFGTLQQGAIALAQLADLAQADLHAGHLEHGADEFDHLAIATTERERGQLALERCLQQGHLSQHPRAPGVRPTRGE